MVQLPNHINNTIEDAICYLGGSFGHLLDEREQIAIQQFDQPIIKSLTNQIEKGLAFTQKQGPIGIRLVTRYVNALARVGFDTEKLVNEKPFAKPFRVIDKTKSIYIDGEELVCKSPFIADLVNNFKKRKNNPAYKRGNYRHDTKEWAFQFNEKNIEFLVEAVKGKAFDVDDEIKNIYKKIKQVKANALDHFPMLTYTDKFEIKNIDLPDEYKNKLSNLQDVQQATMFSKTLGITVYDETIESKLKNNEFKKIYLGHHNNYTINKKVIHNRKRIAELVFASDQTIIMVSSLDKQSLIDWIDICVEKGFADQTAVCFRYPKDTEMNEYIKNKGVNKFDPTKKILIVNEKIPKPFIKAKVNPNLILVDLATQPSHHKTQLYLANKPLLVYYTHKGDTDIGIL